MRHGRSCVAVVHRLVAGGPVELELAALCTWRDAHGERHADGPTPRSSRSPTGRSSRARTGWPGRAGARGAVVAGRAPPGGGGPRPEPGRGPLLRGPVHRASWRARRRRWRCSAWAGDLADAPPPAAEVVAAARGATGGGGRGEAGRRVDATLALAADAFIVRTAAGPDVVAGYPWFGAWSRDTMTSYEGLFLTTGRAEEGRELLRGVRGDAVGGHAGQHRRHRPRRVQHRRRDAVVPARGRAGTSRSPGTPTWPPSCCRRCDGVVARAPARAPATASGSTRPTGCSPRAPTGRR